jgi:hypothetical protein
MGAKLTEAEARKAALQEQLERARQQAARAPPSRPAPLLPAAADGRLDARATSTLIWGAEGSAALPFASPVASPAVGGRGRRAGGADADAPQGPAARDQGAAAAAAAAADCGNKPPGAVEALRSGSGGSSGLGFPAFGAARAQSGAASSALGMLSALRESLSSRLRTPGGSAASGSAPASPPPPPPPRSVADSEDFSCAAGRSVARAMSMRDSRSGLADLVAGAPPAAAPVSEAGGDAAASASGATPASGVTQGGHGLSPVRSESGAAQGGRAGAPAAAAPAPVPAALPPSAVHGHVSGRPGQRRRAPSQAPKPHCPSRRRERLVKAVVALGILYAGAAEARPEAARAVRARSKDAFDWSNDALRASGRATRSAWRRLRGQEDADEAAGPPLRPCCAGAAGAAGGAAAADVAPAAAITAAAAP